MIALHADSQERDRRSGEIETWPLTGRRPYKDGLPVLPLPGHPRRRASRRPAAQGRVVALRHCQIRAGVTPVNDVGRHWGTNGRSSKCLTVIRPPRSSGRLTTIITSEIGTRLYRRLRRDDFALSWGAFAIKTSQGARTSGQLTRDLCTSGAFQMILRRERKRETLCASLSA